MEKNLLIVTIKTDDLQEATMEAIRKQLKSQLPNHDVAILGVNAHDDVSIMEVRRAAGGKEEG